MTTDKLSADSSHSYEARTNAIVRNEVLPPVTLYLDVNALEMVSSNAASCFVKYWKAICARDVDAGLETLSEAFVDDGGGKELRRRLWKRHSKTEMGEEVKGEVAKVERVNVYNRASSPPFGKTVEFKGNLLVVEGCATVRREDKIEGPSQLTWVLESPDDKVWLVRSEHNHGD